MGLKEIFSSLKSSSTTTTTNGNSKRNLISNSSSKKNRYDLHNYSLDNDYLLENNAHNCILINKTNLNNTTSPPSKIIPTLTRHDSTRSNNSSSALNSNEPTRLLIENHAKHVTSILSINSQTTDKLRTKCRDETLIKNKMVTSPSCDVGLLLGRSSPDRKNTPESRSGHVRTRIKTNPWIRSPSFHNTPIAESHPHVRSQTNENIVTLNNETASKFRFNKLNLSFNNTPNEATVCKKCFSSNCSCLQKSKDSGISSIINNQQFSPSPAMPNSLNHNSFDSKTSSSSSSLSSLNQKNAKQAQYSSNSLEQHRANDDYSILFEEALESSSNESYNFPKNNNNSASADCKLHFKRNISSRFSLDQNRVKRKSLILKEANFVAEVTNLFDKALLELPDFINDNNKIKSPKFNDVKQNPVNNSIDDGDEDDLELENSVNELYKQIEILKEQKKMLDEKVKIAKQETKSVNDAEAKFGK